MRDGEGRNEEGRDGEEEMEKAGWGGELSRPISLRSSQLSARG